MVVRAKIASDRIVLGNEHVNCANFLAGKLSALYNDGMESFIAIELAGGEIIQADMESCQLAGLDLEQGQRVVACFPARAVTLQAIEVLGQYS